MSESESESECLCVPACASWLCLPLLVLLRQPSSGLLAACLSCCVSLKSSRRRRNQASVTWTGATPLLANTTWVLGLVGCNASLMRACTRSSVWYSHTFSLFHTHTHTLLPPSPSLSLPCAGPLAARTRVRRMWCNSCRCKWGWSENWLLCCVH